MKKLLNIIFSLALITLAPCAYSFVQTGPVPPAKLFGIMDFKELRNGTEQLLIVQWVLRANPLTACGQHRQVTTHNGLCATLSFDHQGPVCTIITQHQATHQDLGVLFQWCMSRELALRSGASAPVSSLE